MAPIRVNTRTFVASCIMVAALEFGLAHLDVSGLRASYLLLGACRLLEAVLLVIFTEWLGKSLADIGLCKRTLLHGALRGIYWSLGFGALAGVGMIIMFAMGQNPFVLLHGGAPRLSGWSLTVFFIVGGLVGPIAEELFFRGILYGFVRRWGVIAALVVSTALFVMCHRVGGRIPFTQVVGGLVFALSYEKEKNLMAPIVLHVAGNVSLFSLPLLLGG